MTTIHLYRYGFAIIEYRLSIVTRYNLKPFVNEVFKATPPILHGSQPLTSMICIISTIQTETVDQTNYFVPTINKRYIIISNLGIKKEPSN